MALSLLPEAEANLRDSGWTDETIRISQAYSQEPLDWMKQLGARFLLTFPFLDLWGRPPFSRSKIFDPILDPETNKPMRYYQAKGSGNRLYFLETVVDLLGNRDIPLLCIEGEKKCVTGTQVLSPAVCCVGITGVWGFLKEGDLLSEFDNKRLDCVKRTVYIAMDSDAWGNDHSLRAMDTFAKMLTERGAFPIYFIRIPSGPDGKKWGLDDFLVAKNFSVEEFWKLPQITLQNPIFKKFKTRKPKLSKPAEDRQAEEQTTEPQITEEILTKAMLTQDLIALVEDTIRRFVFIKEDRLYLLIAVWVLATYVYKSFFYFPYLWVTSPGKRAGKTRLLEVLTQLVNVPSGIKINPSVASLYHKTDRGCTLILDEVEKLQQSDHELYGATMAILNGGFQKGSTVDRMMKGSDGNQVEVSYQIYGPKILAGIRSVTDTIRDRSLAIRMLRKVPNSATEKVERFNLRKLRNEFADKVYQLKLWAGARCVEIEEIYDRIEVREKFDDDRFVDIIEPLLSIASLADAEYSNGDESKLVSKRLMTVLKDVKGLRDEDNVDDAAITCVIETLSEILGNDPNNDTDFGDGTRGVFVYSSDLLKTLKGKPPTEWLNSTTSLATNVMSKLGLFPRPDSRMKKRGYKVTRTWLNDIISRYSLSDDFNLSNMSEDQ